MAIFEGSATALITPFHQDGSVDYETLEKLIEDQIAHGTDAIVITGTTGEASTMSHAEHLQTIKFTVEKVAKRIPVIAGTGSNCTETAIMMSQHAEQYGADAVLIVTPYYNKATQKGLIAHYTAVANSIKIPVIMYNVPSRTGCNIQPETAVALAKNVENIVAIKEATGNISQVAKLAALADGCIDIYSGNDDQIVPLLALGGKGVISVLANVAPQQTHDMCQKFFDGDLQGSLKMQLEAFELIEALFCEVNPIPVKAGMNLMGWSAGPLRAPLTEMEPQNQERLAKAMKEYGIKLA